MYALSQSTTPYECSLRPPKLSFVGPSSHVPLNENTPYQIQRVSWGFHAPLKPKANEEGGARTMEIGPIRNQNWIFWPLANVL